MHSLRKLPVLVIEHPVEVSLIKAHMAGSLGVEKAGSVVTSALKGLAYPGEGRLSADQAETLLVKLAAEPGIVGLAAKVTKQMVRNQIAPLAPK